MGDGGIQEFFNVGRRVAVMAVVIGGKGFAMTVGVVPTMTMTINRGVDTNGDDNKDNCHELFDQESQGVGGCHGNV